MESRCIWVSIQSLCVSAPLSGLQHHKQRAHVIKDKNLAIRLISRYSNFFNISSRFCSCHNSLLFKQFHKPPNCFSPSFHTSNNQTPKGIFGHQGVRAAIHVAMAARRYSQFACFSGTAPRRSANSIYTSSA